MPKHIVLYGAGGHGKVVLDAIHSNDDLVIAGFIDDYKTGMHMNIPILGNSDILPNLHKNVDEVFVCIGNNTNRSRIINKLQERNISMGIISHASAVISPLASLSPGCLILAQASVGPSTHLGIGCIINTGATIDHDCTIENYTHVAPGVNIAGNVHIGSKTFIGIGSSIIQNIQIGDGVTLGAGSTVVKDLPNNCTAYGCPAKPQ